MCFREIFNKLIVFQGCFTSNRMAKVPWSVLFQDALKYLEDDCLPDGVVLIEPSKLKAATVALLWDHWTGRQEDGHRGLVFKDALPKDKRNHGEFGTRRRKGKGKAKGKYVEVDDPSESQEEMSRDEEEGVRDKGKRKAKDKGKGKAVAQRKEKGKGKKTAEDFEEFDIAAVESSDSETEEEVEKVVTTWGPKGLPPKKHKGKIVRMAVIDEEAGESVSPGSNASGGSSLIKASAGRPVIKIHTSADRNNQASAGPSNSAPAGASVKGLVSFWKPESSRESGPAHPNSPAGQKNDVEAHLAYLKTLGRNPDYLALIKMVNADLVCAASCLLYVIF
jgi:hypothetical protein